MSSEHSTLFRTLQAAAAANRLGKESQQEEMTPRSHILHLGVLVGNLCSLVLEHAPPDPKRGPLENVEGRDAVDAVPSFWTGQHKGRDEIAKAMGTLLLAFFETSEVCSMDLRSCIVKKLELNERKYPVELCKGKAAKYTAFSHHTGITKTQGQSTVDAKCNIPDETVEEMISRIRVFATERLWSRFHSPRSLVLALMGELGELAELFQWKGDGDAAGLDGWSQEDLDHVGQELADVSIYLLRLADVCSVHNIGVLALQEANMHQTLSSD